MKFEDVRFGLLVVYKNNDIGKVTSIGVYSKDIIINIFDVVDRHVFCTADDIEPFFEGDFMKQKQKEFTWDKSVNTIDKPFERNGSWYIKVDGSVGSIYEKPKQFCYFNTYDNSVQSCEIYATVPTTPYKYISLDNRWCQDMFLPVTYNQKVIEVTMDELEKKYGCRVKIVK